MPPDNDASIDNECQGEQKQTTMQESTSPCLAMNEASSSSSSSSSSSQPLVVEAIRPHPEQFVDNIGPDANIARPEQQFTPPPSPLINAAVVANAENRVEENAVVDQDECLIATKLDDHESLPPYEQRASPSSSPSPSPSRHRASRRNLAPYQARPRPSNNLNARIAAAATDATRSLCIDTSLANRQSSEQHTAYVARRQILANLISDVIEKNNFSLFLFILETFRPELNVFHRGQTALHKCIMEARDVSWCRELISYGANPNLCNLDGWHPFHLASFYGNGSVLSFLLSLDWCETSNIASHSPSSILSPP